MQLSEVIIAPNLSDVKSLHLSLASAIINSGKGGGRVDLWKRQINLAQYMLLGTVIVTVLNIAFLLGNVDMYISYSAALPYYLVWLGKIFDNGRYMGPLNGQFTATGLVMAGILLAIWLVLWWLARGSRRWLQVGLWVVAADFAVLAIVALVLMSNPLSCLWEAVLHGAVIWEIYQGLKAWKQMEDALQQPARQEEFV